MQFEDLSREQRHEVGTAMCALLAEAEKQGLSSTPIELPQGRVATLARWPMRLDRGIYIGSPGEIMRAPNKTFYILERREVDFLDARVQWSAKSQAKTLLQTCGLSESEAERELYRWFHIPFEVFVIIRACAQHMTDQILVGVRSQCTASNQGMLSFPGGFVRPKERLIDTLTRYLDTEVPGLVFDHRDVVFTFGAHNVAPSLTFCATIAVRADYDQMFQQNLLMPSNLAWEGETLIWASEEDVYAALVGDLNPMKKLCHSRGIKVVQGFAPDVVGPLCQQLSMQLGG